jgi:hypothetical protein
MVPLSMKLTSVNAAEKVHVDLLVRPIIGQDGREPTVSIVLDELLMTLFFDTTIIYNRMNIEFKDKQIK